MKYSSNIVLGSIILAVAAALIVRGLFVEKTEPHIPDSGLTYGTAAHPSRSTSESPQNPSFDSSGFSVGLVSSHSDSATARLNQRQVAADDRAASGQPRRSDLEPSGSASRRTADVRGSRAISRSGSAADRSKRGHLQSTHSAPPDAFAGSGRQPLPALGRRQPLDNPSPAFGDSSGPHDRLAVMPAAIFKFDDSTSDPEANAVLDEIARDFVNAIEKSGYDPESLEYLRFWNLQQLIADTRFKTRLGGTSWMKHHLASNPILPPQSGHLE